MPFATSLDAWLIASTWLATNSFGFSMSNFTASSYFTIAIGYVVTLFHHGYLFRDLRRDPSLPIRRVYKFLFPCMILFWISGAMTSILSAFYMYEIFYIRNGVTDRGIVGINQAIAGGMALIEAGLLVVIWVKCNKFKSSVGPSKSTDAFDSAGIKA